MSDKPNLFITVVNAFEFKEITEVHNAHLKMLLENDETRPPGCRMTATRQHLARLLKYYPRQPCAPSLIKSRFFSHILQIYLQYLLSYILKFLICIHAGNPRVPPRVLACGGNNEVYPE